MESPGPTPENLTSPKVTMQEIYEVQDTVNKLFDAKRTEAEIVPYGTLVDVLTETITTSPINGKRYKLSRERPGYADNPTKIAYEAPLVKNVDGKNIYITPVTITVLDEVSDKETMKIILETDQEKYSDDSGTHGRLYVDAYEHAQTWDDIMLSRVDAKELIAHLSWATKN